MNSKKIIRIASLLFILVNLTAYSNAEENSESAGTIIYSYVPQAQSNKKNATSNIADTNYKTSMPIKFDILLDEKVDIDDPRIKSIAYIAIQNNVSFIKITYSNPNAVELANKLFKLFNSLGLSARMPTLLKSSSTSDFKNVSISIKYLQPEPKVSASSIVKQNSSGIK